MSRRATAPRPRRRTPAVPRVPSKLEAQFALAWKLLRPAGMPLPVTELRFCERRWRFDFAFRDPVESRMGGVAVELEGGVYSRGRHTRAAGFIADAEKYNAAVLAGWVVLRFTAADLKRPQSVVDTVAAALRLRGWA